jgi:hypothetical protein
MQCKGISTLDLEACGLRVSLDLQEMHAGEKKSCNIRCEGVASESSDIVTALACRGLPKRNEN